MVDPDYLKDINELGVCGGFAGVGGALAYLVKVQEGKPFTWGGFLLQIAVSSLAGVIAFKFLHAYGVSSDLTAALCGLSGWMGITILKIAEKLIIFTISKRAGVDVTKKPQKED